jgi:hypothetical protein
MILATLIYTYTLERTRCRRRLVSRLRQLVSFGSTNESYPVDSFLYQLDPQQLQLYQIEAQRILKIMHYEFPSIVNYKKSTLTA